MHPLSYHQDNRAAWNITAAKYEADEADDIAFLRAGGTSLLPPEQAVLGDLADWCARAIHLQCAGGLDTLSLLHHGAGAVTGVDISERMIASAQRKTQALGAPAGWYCCDVLQTPHVLDATADLVHTGRGALPWIMDLNAWAAMVHRLLKPGGRLHIFEGHPLDWAWDADADHFRFHPARSGYFDTGVGGGDVWPRPFIERQEGIDPGTIHARDRQWTLGQIFQAVLAAGLQIEFFDEYPLLFWNQFPDIPEEQARRLPHSFTLVAKKP